METTAKTRMSAGTPKAVPHLTVAERTAHGKAARGMERSAEHAPPGGGRRLHGVVVLSAQRPCEHSRLGSSRQPMSRSRVDRDLERVTRVPGRENQVA
jgi:hypothetical protein